MVSPTGVRSVWLRTGLQTFKLRLAALEKKVAEEGIVLTEAQVAALERKRSMFPKAQKAKLDTSALGATTTMTKRKNALMKEMGVSHDDTESKESTSAKQ